SSVQQQLAQLAAGAQVSPTASVEVRLSSTPQSGPTRAALQPSPTRTRRPTSASASTPRTTRRPSATPTQRPPASARATRTPSDGLPTISEAKLPPEARHTIALIRQGGPFPYDKDGATFGNREGLLPKRPSGYYHEYTVITPGSRDRGARRVIAGDGGELYYTDDHYDSFKRVVP
ncbi:MAG: ribonuclease domain-containing protein, partial [Bacteroidota bacterium]